MIVLFTFTPNNGEFVVASKIYKRVPCTQTLITHGCQECGVARGPGKVTENDGTNIKWRNRNGILHASIGFG